MVQLEPIWQNIPITFKRSLVGKLNYVDRCALRVCSTAEKELVDACETELESVALQVRHDHSMFSFADDVDTVFAVKYYATTSSDGSDRMRVEIVKSPTVFKPRVNEKTLWKKTSIVERVGGENDIDFAIRDFEMTVRRLKVKKILINEVIVKEPFEMGTGARRDEFEAKLLKTLEQKTSRKIETETLHLKWTSNDTAGRLLAVFKPGKLRRIELSARNATWKLKEDVARMEQWKAAEEVWLEMRSDVDARDLLHFKKIQMFVGDLTVEQVGTVVKNVISKKQHLASFHFSYRDRDVELDALLARLNVPALDQPITGKTILRKSLISRFVHTQRIPIPGTELVLVVLFSDKEVIGTVCHVTRVDNEAIVDLAFLR